MTTASSLFASLGAALQAFPSPRFHLRTPVAPLKTNPFLTAFESDLAAQLQDLKAVDDAGFLSLPWLSQAMSLVLSTHSNVEAFVPDLQHAIADGKITWLDEYLDESVKLLDICNLLRDTVWDMKLYHTLVELALHAFANGCSAEAQLRRGKNALAKCTMALKRKDEEFSQQGRKRSKLETCSSILRRMGEKLNPEDASKGNFFSAIYAAQITTISVCSLLTAALCFKPKRPFSSLAIAGHSSWALALTSLQQRVKEQMDKRKAKGSAALLEELDKADIAVRSCQELVDKLLAKKVFPLDNDDEREMLRAVLNLGNLGNALVEGLNSLEQQISDLFRVLISSRMVLLDIYSYSYKGRF